MRRHSARGNAFMLFLLLFNILLFFSLITAVQYMGADSAFFAFLLSPWSLVATQVVGFAVPLLIFVAVTGRASGVSFGAAVKESVGPRKPMGITNMALVAAIAIFVQPAMMLLSAVTAFFVPNPVPGMLAGLQALPIPVALLIVAVTPSVFEEWAFRGYIQGQYAGRPIWAAALINGLFFGIIHTNLHQFPYAFAMGVVFTLLVYHTQSVFAAFWAHFIINGTQLLLDRLAHFVTAAANEPLPEITPALIREGIAALAVLAGVFLPVAVFLLVLLARHNRPRRAECADSQPAEPVEPVEQEEPVEPVERVEQEEPVEPAERAQSKTPLDACFWAVIVVYAAYMWFLWTLGS